MTPHFTLAELTNSATAKAIGLLNTPSAEHRGNLLLLASEVLEPIRAMFGKPVRISSGYRSPALNAALRRKFEPRVSSTSQHMEGKAADIWIPEIANIVLARRVAESEIPFDQLILEEWDSTNPYSGWVHVSYDIERQRRQVLNYTSEHGMENGLPAYDHVVN